MNGASKKRVVAFALGIVGLLAAGFITFVAGTAASGLPWATTTDVKVAFTDVGTLRAGDDVRENSVRIGQVGAVEMQEGRAVVTLRLDGEVPVFADARAAIWDESALAKRFVELHRGTEEAGPVGDEVIDKSANLAATELDDVLGVFDPETRAKLSGAVRGLGVGAAGHSRDLHDLLTAAPELLDDVGTVASALASREADLPALLHSADALAAAFNGHEQRLAALVGDLGTTLDAVSVDDGAPLRESLRSLPSTLDEADGALDALTEPLRDTRQAMVDTAPGAASLGVATPDVRGILREAIPPLGKVPGVAEQAEPALDRLTGTVQEARPLAPRLSEGLIYLAPTLQVLAPYSKDIVTFFGRANSMVSTSLAPGIHVARLGVAVSGLAVVDGGLVHDPMSHRVPYPAPGTADGYRAPSLLTTTSGGAR